MNTSTDTPTLQHLVDRIEIGDLVNRLGAALDEGRFDILRSLLAEDVTVRTPGGTAEGRDAVVAQASRNHQPEQAIQHIITNLLVDLADDGDHAQVRANLVVSFGPPAGTTDASGPPALPAPPVELTMGEIYGFGLTRTPEGWRFSRIETTPVWIWGTPPRPPSAD